MIFTSLGPLRIRTSVLGFGCAPMGSRYGSRESLRALATAYELGVNYFDVARAYGYGDAESILGKFIRDKRDRVIVATKFGIDPPQLTRSRRALKAIARRAFRLVPQLRRVAKKQLGSQFTKRRFDAADMARSVETSLRQLRTDRIDVLLIHDCSVDAIEDDGLFDALRRLVEQGKVGALGATGPRTVVEKALVRRTELSVAQVAADVSHPASRGVGQDDRRVWLAYHAFGGEDGVKQMCDRVRRATLSDQTPSDLRQKLREMHLDRVVGELALSGTRANGAIDVVLVTMFSPEHIAANARAAAAPVLTREELSYLTNFRP